MKKRFFSILTKIRWAFLSLFAVFLLIVAYILGVQYKGRALEDIQNQIKYEDEMLSQALEARIQNTNSSLNMMIIQLNRTMPLSEWDEEFGPRITPETQKNIYSCMVGIFTNFYNAEQMMIVWKNGVNWYENRTENYSMQSDGQELLQELEDLGVNRNGSWLTRISSESQIKGSGCYYAKPYVDIETGREMGYVILKITDLLKDIHKKGSERDREVYLFDSAGNLVESSKEEAVRQRDECQEAEGRLEYAVNLKQELQDMESDRQQIIHTVSFGAGWELISVSNISQKMNELYQSITSILFASIALLVLIYVVTFRIIKRILHPIQMLSGHMDSLQDQLPIPLHIPIQNDETGVLISHFNKMTQRNQELVNLLLEEKKKQEELKLSLLQAQIKPHFLYNTLDTIYCLVIMGKNEEGSRMTKLLSMYYRHVLSRGMDWVLLSEEVQQTEHYLQIQKIRYRDLLEFEIQVDDEVDNIKIPKLTLQPLVENAIYHGIKPAGRKGNLKVVISQEKDTILIRVQDDGIGFTEEKFRECVESEHFSEGFGLKNVRDRLKLYYNDKCELRLEACSQGTSLLLVITTENGKG